MIFLRKIATKYTRKSPGKFDSLLSGLAAGYRFEDNLLDSYKEMHGLGYNTPVYSNTGIIGKSLSTSSTSQMTLPNNVLFNLPEEFSISFFIKAANTGVARVFTLNSQEVGLYLSIRINEPQVHAITVYIKYNNIQPGITVNVPNITLWNHINVKVKKSSFFQITANSNSSSSAVLPENTIWNTINSDNRNVVGGARNYTLPLNGGYIDLLYLHNRVITEAENARLFNNGNGLIL